MSSFIPENIKIKDVKIGDVVFIVRSCPCVSRFFPKYEDGKTLLTIIKLNEESNTYSCGSGENRGVCSQMWNKLNSTQRIITFKETSMHCCVYPLGKSKRRRNSNSVSKSTGLILPNSKEWRSIIER